MLSFFCWWYSLLESHWMCDSNELSNYGYVSVDILRKEKNGLNIVTCTALARIQNVLSERSNFDKGFLVDERIKKPL